MAKRIGRYTSHRLTHELDMLFSVYLAARDKVGKSQVQLEEGIELKKIAWRPIVEKLTWRFKPRIETLDKDYVEEYLEYLEERVDRRASDSNARAVNIIHDYFSVCNAFIYTANVGQVVEFAGLYTIAHKRCGLMRTQRRTRERWWQRLKRRLEAA